MPIDFPDNPGLTPTYSYTYKGITQFWEWGFKGGSGISAWISAGYGISAAGGGAPAAGNDREIQYKSGTSLSANSLATVVTSSGLTPSSGYSGNFVHYSESVLIDDTRYSANNSSLSVSFGGYNIYRATNIGLAVGATMTVTGFSSATTGDSLTLILGYTGGTGSNIKFPASHNIYWAGGPVGDSGGATAIIDTNTSTKIIDVIYFFHDGSNLYANYQVDYRKS